MQRVRGGGAYVRDVQQWWDENDQSNSGHVSMDRRTWSITGDNLFGLVGELGRLGFPSCSVHTLGGLLRKNHVYLARDFEQRFSQKPADIFITYDWRTNFVDLQEKVWSALEWIKGLLRHHYDEDPDADRLVYEEITLWIDFLCIDQGARDLVGELDVLPSIIDSAGVHLVLSPSAFTRAWCCYEVALFNARTADREDRSLISLVPIGSRGFGLWSGVQSTDPADKAALEQRIRTEYPGGFDAFEFIMVQSNLIGERPGSAWTLAAEEQVIHASRQWVPPGFAPKPPSSRPGEQTTRWIAGKFRLPKPTWRQG